MHANKNTDMYLCVTKTAKSGQLPLRMKVNAAAEQFGRCKLGHTVRLKKYDKFSKGDVITNIKYPNVLVYMHPGLPGDLPTMVRFLKVFNIL